MHAPRKVVSIFTENTCARYVFLSFSSLLTSTSNTNGMRTKGKWLKCLVQLTCKIAWSSCEVRWYWNCDTFASQIGVNRGLFEEWTRTCESKEECVGLRCYVKCHLKSKAWGFQKNKVSLFKPMIHYDFYVLTICVLVLIFPELIILSSPLCHFCPELMRFSPSTCSSMFTYLSLYFLSFMLVSDGLLNDLYLFFNCKRSRRCSCRLI